MEDESSVRAQNKTREERTGEWGKQENEEGSFVSLVLSFSLFFPFLLLFLPGSPVCLLSFSYDPSEARYVDSRNGYVA
jgi:hypothetical protein